MKWWMWALAIIAVWLWYSYQSGYEGLIPGFQGVGTADNA
jgi:hypothetical protein